MATPRIYTLYYGRWWHLPSTLTLFPHYTGTRIVQTQGLCMASWPRCTSLRCSLELWQLMPNQRSPLLAMMVKWYGDLESIMSLRSPCHSCPLTLNWGGLGRSSLRMSLQLPESDCSHRYMVKIHNHMTLYQLSAEYVIRVFVKCVNYACQLIYTANCVNN